MPSMQNSGTPGTTARAAETRPSNRRSLMPKEHGAYAEAAFPLATGVILGSPGIVSWLLVLAAAFAFFAHEPVLVLRGVRGVRARNADADRARVRMAWLLFGAAVAGVAALAMASAAVRWAALLPLLPGAGYAVSLARGYDKTLLRDLLASSTFSLLAFPIALAGGASVPVALAGGVVWLVTFALQTLLVRGTVATSKSRRRSPLLPPFLAASLTAVVAVWLAVRPSVPVLAAFATLPAALHVLAFCVWPVPARRLKRLGWSLAAADVAVFVVLVTWSLEHQG